MWDVKQKATNKTNSQTQTTAWWLPQLGRGQGEVAEGEGGQIYTVAEGGQTLGAE